MRVEPGLFDTCPVTLQSDEILRSRKTFYDNLIRIEIGPTEPPEEQKAKNVTQMRYEESAFLDPPLAPQGSQRRVQNERLHVQVEDVEVWIRGEKLP